MVVVIGGEKVGVPDRVFFKREVGIKARWTQMDVPHLKINHANKHANANGIDNFKSADAYTSAYARSARTAASGIGIGNGSRANKSVSEMPHMSLHIKNTHGEDTKLASFKTPKAVGVARGA